MLFSRVVQLYERRGYRVLSSVAPILWMVQATHKDVPPVAMPNDRLFSYIFNADGSFCSAGGGLHMTELYLLEHLAEVLSPKRIFVVGNAFGWGTLALALAFPEARVLAIDNGSVDGGNRGVDLVNAVAREESINVVAAIGSSPTDVETLVSAHLRGSVDLVLIDGDHKNAQQTLDFEACQRVASPECVYLLHDVINWALIDSFDDLLRRYGDTLHGEVLTRTASGMAILYPKILASQVRPVAQTFVDSFATTEFQKLPQQA